MEPNRRLMLGEESITYAWHDSKKVGKRSFLCGYCGKDVGPDEGYFAVIPEHQNRLANIFICPLCTQPTFIDFNGKQYPNKRFGNEVSGITDEKIQKIYLEARDAASAGAHTAAVLISRKILMNVAVQKGAKKGLTFNNYVEYLVNAGYVPPEGKSWVDKIRDKGNDATHEIELMTEADAKLIIHFTEMLLRFVYELPSMLK